MQIRFMRMLWLALVALTMMLMMSAASSAQIGVAITFGPPPIPVYEQPLCPGDGYLWTPGYWAYDYDFGDYYWVPGTWVLAPEVGFLWTPGWWGWSNGAFIFNEGYWGPMVGFYGGINYGFGYFGVGFEGGRWDGGHFFYNRAVMNVNVTVIHNVYNTTVINNNNHISFNGGNGGINARPTSQEEAAGRERHIGPVAEQVQHAQAARADPQQRASVNMGRPAVAATPRPGAFKDSGVVRAQEAGGSYTPPANRGGNAPRPSTPTHVRELPPPQRLPAPNTGNPKVDQKYQQQQEKLYNQQQQERQKIAQQQEKEDQRLAKQKAPDEARQQQEQRHQQQTQQLQQKHQQQQQQLQERQAPRSSPSRPPK